MTLILNGTDNSATTPAVTGTDADTGVYYPAANQVALATNGTLALVVDSSQNVGIGIASPTFQLQMSGGTTVTSRIQLNRGSDDSNQNLRIGWNSIKTTRLNVPIAGVLTNLDFVQVGSDGERVCFSMATNGSLEVNYGIKFPATQSASSDANTLDDYEEGNWTPQLVGGTTVGTPVNGAGFYTKVGNLVTIFYAFESVSPPSGADGILMIRSMPFPLSSSTTVYNYANPSLIFTNGGTSLANMWWGHRADDTNSTRFYFTYYANVNVAPSNFIVTNLGGSGNFLRGYFSYQV
jgi:hypothetical protein